MDIENWGVNSAMADNKTDISIDVDKNHVSPLSLCGLCFMSIYVSAHISKEFNALDYEEKVVDGFYDVYGISPDLAIQGKMPSLKNLETNLGSSGFKVSLVNRKVDPILEELVQIAQRIALDCPVTNVGVLVQRLVELISERMGGPVKDANAILMRWMERSIELRTSMQTGALPIGSIIVGLSRHRAFAFQG